MKTNLAAGLVFTALLLCACATTPEPACGPNDRGGPHCPPASAVDDAFTNELYENRTWYPDKELRAQDFDPVQVGSAFEIPVNRAAGKFIGTSNHSARDSLAAKIWMIENARHTVDFVYYIFNNDVVGYAMVGAMCRAIERGVDVRVIVDSVGSMSTPKHSLTALETCEDRAGFMRTADGRLTNRRARAQVIVFNALTKLSSSPNRRSHDKLLLVDGAFDERALMMTGGRNISLAYYGLDAEGNLDPYAYMDAEILLRPLDDDVETDLGRISSGYFSLLFLYRGNKLMTAVDSENAYTLYLSERKKALESLDRLKAMPIMKPHFDAMPEFMTGGFRETKALLAHELANLDNRNVVRQAVENYRNNPNSIINVLQRISDESDGSEISRMVSPYLFLARYTDDDGNVIVDEAQEIRRWLEEHPEAEIEIITNSVMTSDNFSAQSIIDLDAMPRLLLDPETRQAWLDLKTSEERTDPLTTSAAWIEQVNHPRLRVYETGKLDASYFIEGGVPYGKLHAKYWLEDDTGYVGTSNFDYRSRLFNNEMGYFFRSEPLAADLNADFELLKSKSHRWGSPEWLEMREKTREMGGIKGTTARAQRQIFKTLDKTGLHWLF